MTVIENRKNGKGRSNNVNKDVISLLSSLDIFTNRATQMPVVVPVPISIPSTTTTTPARRLSDPGSSQKTRRQMYNEVKPSLIDLLLKVGYQNEDYCEKALENYLEWCDTRFSGNGLYEGMIMSLQTLDIGVDMLEDVDDVFKLAEQCSASYGVMTRIVKNVRLWITTIVSKN